MCAIHNARACAPQQSRAASLTKPVQSGSRLRSTALLALKMSNVAVQPNIDELISAHVRSEALPSRASARLLAGTCSGVALFEQPRRFCTPGTLARHIDPHATPRPHSVRSWTRFCRRSGATPPLAATTSGCCASCCPSPTAKSAVREPACRLAGLWGDTRRQKAVPTDALPRKVLTHPTQRLRRASALHGARPTRRCWQMQRRASRRQSTT